MSDLTLEIEVRAKRAAKRKNKQLSEKYPLLADQFAVTVESQVTRLEKQETDNDAYFERMHQASLEAWERGQEYKEKAIEFLPPQLFDELEGRYQRIYGSCGKYALPEYAGHDLADWWWCALRDQNVPWCWDHCPNEFLHSQRWNRKEGRCPTCHKPLDPPDPEKEKPTQASFL